MNIKSVAVIVIATLIVFITNSNAQGTDLTATMLCSEGEATVNIQISDTGVDPGELLVSVEVGNMLAEDLRAVYFDLDIDDLFLSGLAAHGPEVTSFAYSKVINLGPQTNLRFGGSPCPCDFGVEIGTSGKGRDLIHTAAFTLAHDSIDLDLSMFFEQNVGARISGADSKCKAWLPVSVDGATP